MFQNFAARTRPETGPPRLAELRALLTARGLDGFLVPRADAHQGEYVAARDERLAWLTSFTGSAGFCAALRDVAGVFVDGRYTLQVADQVDLGAFTPVKHPDVKLGDWLKEQLPQGGQVGYDPWLYTLSQIEQLNKALSGSGIALTQCDNLVDALWADQPGPPRDLMVPYPLRYAGTPHGEKRANLAKILREAGQTCAILTQPDAIAWLLNTRGTDLGQTPATLAFGILHADSTVDLFLEEGKWDADLKKHLGPDVRILPRSGFEAHLANLSTPVRVDAGTTPVAIADCLTKAAVTMVRADDPVSLPKACKSEAELSGSKAAHLRDGAAICKFLAWLDQHPDQDRLTEIDIVKQLEGFRRATGELQNISFDTISGAGSHGAIVHYRVTDQTNRPLVQNSLLLVDSGGQYLDGTTDITRTLAIGIPPADAIRAFTLVLKGMINLSRLRFPKGVSGRDIDAIARAALWQQGMDYDHGTGHGVGAYLGVHEGPQGISRRSAIPLRPGMILSNEPGYYREGAFGIRIENLVFVTPAAPGIDPDREFYQFETLTCAPIDRRLIDPALLTDDELDWLNTYHAWVHDQMHPRLASDVQGWLDAACAPLTRAKSDG